MEIIVEGAIACLGWGGRSLWEWRGRSLFWGYGKAIGLVDGQGIAPLLDKSKSAIAFWVFLAIWKGISVLWMDRGDRSLGMEKAIAKSVRNARSLSKFN
ncbi:hypothetical protein QUB26_28035 [Microcoleus sp. B4-C1]